MITWDGDWVAERLHAHLDAVGDGRPDDIALRRLAGLALRRNPKRAHLIVSSVLGKHVPVAPSTVLNHAAQLATRVREQMDVERGVVLGFAETATGLGEAVAAALDLPAVFSTRRVVDTEPYGAFEESHSHAADHIVAPSRPLLDVNGPVVLVDDELTTGNTAANTIRALHAAHPHRGYVVASLLDLRGGRSALEDLAVELDVPVRVASLQRASLQLPGDVLTRGASLVETLSHPRVETEWEAMQDFTAGERAVLDHEVFIPGEASFGPARLGRTADEHDDVRELAKWVAQEIINALNAEDPATGEFGTSGRVIVLGTEEFMYEPTLVAAELERLLPNEVLFSSTTRSPVAVLDHPGYAVRSGIAFRSYDRTVDGEGIRYAYNIASPQRGDRIVAILEADSYLEQGKFWAPRQPGGLSRALLNIDPELTVMGSPLVVTYPKWSTK